MQHSQSQQGLQLQGQQPYQQGVHGGAGFQPGMQAAGQAGYGMQAAQQQQPQQSYNMQAAVQHPGYSNASGAHAQGQLYGGQAGQGGMQL